MANRPGTTTRFALLALVFVFGYGAIGFRLVELHAVKSPELESEVERTRFRVLREAPRRGDIVDARGEILATSRIFLELGVDRHVIAPSDIEKLPTLAHLLGMPLADVRAAFALKNGRTLTPPEQLARRWVRLQRDVEPRVYEEVKDLGLRCLTMNKNYQRRYPQGSLASHLIGYTRRDGQAVMGVERAFDYYLSGEEGWTETELGRSRKEMAQFRRRKVDATDGFSVQLTIDSYVQFAIEKELQSIVEKFDPEAATIIVSDPYTGDVLGLGNYPTFDPNDYASADDDARKNRALTDILEPGSTFKIVAATAALEERLVSVDTEIDCAQPVAVMADGYRVKLPKDDHEMGILTVGQVISQSSNRGAAHLGFRLGEEGFHSWVTKYGFGEYTGLGLDSESKGILHPVKRWDRLTLSRMTMGHSIAATPMQIHMATATLANGGILMKPRVVRGIADADGETIVEFGPLPKRKVFSRSTAQTVSLFLEEAASTKGTARRAAIDGYRVAGKTGTTQKIIDGRYSSSKHVGSFTGFFPVDNPQVVITVIVDGGKPKVGLAYGGVVAAPSFRNIALQLIPHYAISPSPAANGLAENFSYSTTRGRR